MSIHTDTYRQLTAMANSADRGNRPTTFIVIGGLAMIAGLIVLVVTWRAYSSMRGVLAIQEAKTQNIANLVAEFEALEARKVDLSDIYPPVSDFEASVYDAFDRAGIPFETPPRVNPIDQRVMSAIKGNLLKSQVKCTAVTEKLEHILTWIDNVVHHPKLKERVFVDNLSLTPNPADNTWSVSVEFALYETRRN